MTTSFITDQIDQELQLTDLQNVNGGTGVELALAGLAGVGLFMWADLYLIETTGKGVTANIIDAAKDAMNSSTDSSDQGDGGNVAPTGNGKGCTDRGLPF